MTDNLTEQGLKDGLTMFAELRKILVMQERRAEEKMSEAENELNAARKVRGYLDIQIEDVRRRLTRMQQEKG